MPVSPVSEVAPVAPVSNGGLQMSNVGPVTDMPVSSKWV